jgi:hypothetical protein
MLLCYCALVEIFISYDRLLMFKSIKYLIKLRFFHATAVTISISILINMPMFFATHIAQLAPNRFVSLRSLVAESVAYRVYSIVFNLGQAFIAFILLLMLNVLVTIEFNKHIEKKNNMTKTKSIVKSGKKSTTKAESALENTNGTESI